MLRGGSGRTSLRRKNPPRLADVVIDDHREIGGGERRILEPEPPRAGLAWRLRAS